MSKQIEDTNIPGSLPMMDNAAWYQIQIVGKLESSWSDRLGGMKITVESQVGKVAITTLNGQVLDQCALAGVLTTLHELHFPILSLKYVARNDSKNEGKGCD